MQIAQQGTAANSAIGVDVAEPGAARRPSYADYKIIRRNGAVVGFEPAKISVAMTKAYLAVAGSQGAASARIRELVADLTESVVNALLRRQPQGGTFHIEDIQDQVELALMRSGEHDVARAYVLYREERAKVRAQEKTSKNEGGLHVVENGARRPLDRNALRACGLSERKGEYIADLARHFADGTIHVGRWPAMSDEEVTDELIQVRGIGRWTAEMFLIFNLLRPDVLPVDDLGLRRAVSVSYRAGRRVSETSIRRIAHAWQPWRSVATWYLWRSLDPVPVEY